MKTLTLLAVSLILSGCASWHRVQVKPRRASPESIAQIKQVAADMQAAWSGVVFTSP